MKNRSWEKSCAPKADSRRDNLKVVDAPMFPQKYTYVHQ